MPTGKHEVRHHLLARWGTIHTTYIRLLQMAGQPENVSAGQGVFHQYLALMATESGCQGFRGLPAFDATTHKWHMCMGRTRALYRMCAVLSVLLMLG